MRYLWMMVILVVGLGQSVAAQAGQTAQTGQIVRQIVVNGHGVVDGVPDMAMVSLGVEHDARTAKAAMAEVNAATAAVLDRLRRAGIEDRDMQTSDLSLQPIWNNASSSVQKRHVGGFTASNMVRVRVRDLAAIGEVLDAVVADGANRFQGLQFGLQEPGPAQDEARRLAVADAMARAALLAEAAGVNLGPVQSISDDGGRAGDVRQMDMMRSGAGVPVMAGEVSVSASVSMVFGIAE